MPHESSGRKRLLYRLKLSTRMADNLSLLSEEIGIPRRTIVAGVMNWFFRQDSVLRRLIVGAIPVEARVDVARQALSERA